MKILGIDPGLAGGMVMMRPNGVIESFPFPTLDGELDLYAIKEQLQIWCPDHCFIERVGPRPLQSAQSGFSFGKGYGQLLGLLVGETIPYERVTPQTWMKEFFVLKGGLTPKERKERCLKAVKELFPNVNLLATNRSKVAHAGLVDALLICEHGRRAKT